MSTRSVIARTSGDTFTGVYHHWDGYPSGVGAQLYQLANGHFGGDLDWMLRVLIDQHPAGWSNINGGDFSLPIGFHDDQRDPCAKCGREDWTHYFQNYAREGFPVSVGHEYRIGINPPAGWDPATMGYVLFGHAPEHARVKRGPVCSCHNADTGKRIKGARKWTVTEKDAAGSGCEYAYAINAETRQMFVLASVSEDGGKMVGMFGMGDTDARWRTVAIVNLDAREPDWDELDRKAASDAEPMPDAPEMSDEQADNMAAEMAIWTR